MDLNVILLFAFLFALPISIYTLLNRKVQSNDIEKLQGRLLGRPDKKEKKGSERAALINLGNENRTSAGQQLLEKLKVADRVQALIDQSGAKTTLTAFFNQTLLAALVGFVVAWYFLPERWSSFYLLGAVAGSVVPYFLLVRKRNARIHRFEELFPDSLEFIARSMRAGHAFSVALEMIHREFPDPIAGEFKRTFEEHNLGLPLDVALTSLSRRVQILDVQFFVSAVILQKRTGGNLAEVLDKLASIIRERFKLRGKIRAISAHGRMTATALSSIPIAVGVLTCYTNPPFARFFVEDEIGNYLLGGAVFLQLAGYFVMQKIVKIEV